MKRLTLTAALLAALTAVTTAQPREGRSVVLAGAKGLYELDHTRSRITTLLSMPSGAELNALCMRETNAEALVVDRIGKRLLNHTESGSTSTFLSLASMTAVHGIALDTDGRYVIVDGGSTLYRTNGSDNRSTPLSFANLPAPPTAVCIDDDTGDYIVTVYRTRPAASAVLRIHRTTRAVSTIASGLGQLTGVDHSQRTGDFIVTTRTAPHIRVVRRDGTTGATRTLVGANAVRIDDVNGDVWVAATDRVMRYSETFAVSKAFPGVSGDILHGIELWGRQKIAGRVAEIPSRSTDFTIQGRFPSSPSMPYACALSMAGLRPGIAVSATRTINAALDPIFLATMNGNLPVYTSGFTGRTSGVGGFQSTFLVPPVLLGTQFVFVAVAINPSMPNSIDPASAYPFYVR